MHQREHLRSIPNRGIYFSVDLQIDEDKGVHHFRTPSALQATKIMGAAQDLGTGVSILTRIKDLTLPQIIHLVSEIGPDALSLMGAVVGLAWFHTSLDLEPVRDDHEDLLAYGEAVYEDLHSEDYTLEEIIQMALAVMAQIWERNEVNQEAIEKADFFKRMRERMTSSEQTSKSSGSDHGQGDDSKTSQEGTE